MPDVRIMWPFPVNWASPYRITYGFRTDIFVNRAGGEQRRATRTSPRKTISFSTLADGDRLLSFNRIMATAQNIAVIMPEMTRRAVTAAASIAGATALVVSGALPGWIAAGNEVVLLTDTDRQVAAVAGVAGSTVTFTGVVGAWPAGTAIHPALTGQLASDLRAPRATSTVAEIAVEFAVEPGSETYPVPVAPVSLGDLEVFTIEPNWRTPLDVRHLWPIETVDFGRGRTSVFRPIDFPTRLTSAAFLHRSSGDAEALLDFFVRAKGRRGSFLWSTGEPDIPVAAALTAVGSTLKVVGRDFFDAYAADPVHSAVEVLLRGGQVLRRYVVGMALVDGDTATEVTVENSWGVAASVEQILRVSWLLKCRFGSDDMTIEWVTDSVAQTQAAFQSLPMPAPTEYTLLRATVEGDIRETIAGDDRAIIYL